MTLSVIPLFYGEDVVFCILSTRPQRGLGGVKFTGSDNLDYCGGGRKV
jgi:hypothetical protein